MAVNYEDQLTHAKLFIAVCENTDAEEKKASIMKCLNEGAELNTRFGNDRRNTALHISTVKGDREIVKFLLDNGANVYLKNEDEKTALDIARELNTVEGKEILKILEAYYDKDTDSKVKTKAANTFIETTVQKEKFMYQKRSGTSGVSGQLYETKLLTLVLLRSLTNKDIDHFYLGTNLDGIGALDDLCLRYKHEDKDVVIFLQAKHKIDLKKGKITMQDLWRASGDFSLPKYFNSYLKIKQKFDEKNTNCMFRGRYEDIKCNFVLYTTVNQDLYDKKRVDKKTMDKTVKDLINTSRNFDIFQYEYDEKDINLLTKTILLQRVEETGKKLIEFIQEDRYQMMMSDENIRNFHVVLAQKVINVSELRTEGYRIGTFREDFFSTNEEMLIILKETMYKEAVKKTKLQNKEIDDFIASILCEQSANAISKLIGHIVHYDSQNNRLTINKNKIQGTLYGKRFTELEVRHAIVKEAYEIAGKEKLRSLEFKLPAAFGNTDLTLNENKAQRRLNYLANKIGDVINNSTSKYITIDECVVGPNKLLESGVMDVNGGMGGAVGNLLVLDENSKSLKFNMNDELLGKNAKSLLNNLKKITNNLDHYRLSINIHGFPRISLYPDDYEKRFARDFLDHVWFYTCQATEDEIENIAKNEIDKNYNDNKRNPSAFNIHSDAIFIKFHDEVQKWWMLEHEACYLTDNMNTFNNILSVFVKAPMLSVLNFMYINKTKKYNIEFNADAVQDLRLDEIVSGTIIIMTDANLLSSVKLVQYFKEVNNYKFIDFNYLLSLSHNMFEIVIKEMSTTTNILIIIYENKSTNKDLSKFSRVIHESHAEKVILVTDKNLAAELENIIGNKCVKIKDDKNNLTDLTPGSQQNILEKYFIFQGEMVRFDAAIDSESKGLIKSEMLVNICNEEKIVIGKALLNSHYDEIKEYYVQRSLSKGKTPYSYGTDEDKYYSSSSSTDDDSTYSTLDSIYLHRLPTTPYTRGGKIFFPIKTLDNLDGIVVILAGPGMGKSTLLTHLSIETKKSNPSVWIERINLLDHTRQFRKWQQENIDVDMKNALKLVCEIALTNNKPKYNSHNYREFTFDIDIVDHKLILTNCDIDNGLIKLELELFIHLYNKGNVIFLFDGFDEICPHYKKEITYMLKCIATRTEGTYLGDDYKKGRFTKVSEAKQRMWITSRSYNNIRKTLECHFGTSYTLEPLKLTEQKIYLEKYLQANLSLTDLSYEQFKNIDSLVKYMRNYKKSNYEDDSLRFVKSAGVPLHYIYVAAIEYFQSEIKHIPLTPDKIEFKGKWNLDTRLLTIYDKFLGNAYELNDAMNLAGTPLHMYIAADYFQHEIKEIKCSQDDTATRWDLHANTFAFYARFLDTKLKKIRFEEKNKMNTSNPDIQMTYEKELKEFTENHKKLAFYAIFKENLGNILTDVHLNEIKDIIKGMESGEEKTGLVDYIVNGVPRFVHLVFAEYFAVEFLSDILRNSTSIESQKEVWGFILYNLLTGSSKGVLDVFDHKVKTDPELSNTVSNKEMKEYIFLELLEQAVDPYPPEAYDDFHGDPDTFVETALHKSVYHGLRHVANLLLTTIVDIVDEHNIDAFIGLMTERDKFIANIVDLRFDELLEIILDTIRRVDARKLGSVYNSRHASLHISSTNEDIINELRKRSLSHYYVSYSNIFNF